MGKHVAAKAERCLRKFLKNFPDGFYDETYLSWERDYKWNAHLAWEESLSKKRFRELLEQEAYAEIAAIAVRIESRTNLLFSFEKMALRDAVRPKHGAEAFARSLFDYLHGKGSLQKRFEAFAQTLANLPRKQTRVLTWPLQTVFPFIAQPETHIFLKPRVTMEAAQAYDYPFSYKSKINWDTYQSLLSFADQVRKDFPQLKPRDYIDLQSFIWVQGSDEY